MEAVLNYLSQNLPAVPAEFWMLLGEIAPYLLLGFLVAGLLSVFVSAEFVERHLGGHGLWPIVKAAAFGVPLPLCSCAVVPVAASLRRHGASRGATTAFLMSTPLTGADSILITLSLLGPVFAIFRPIAAIVSAIVGGGLVSLLARGRDLPATPPCQHACCARHDHRPGKLAGAMTYGFWTLPQDIGRSLLGGLALAALISALVPSNALAGLLGGGGGILAILVMMLAGVPVYVCATASVPVAAALVITQGISPGAAFAFLVAGPATNAATVATIWKIMGRRTAIIYVATMMASAVGGGLLLDQLTTAQSVTAMIHAHHTSPAELWIHGIAAVLVLAILLAPILKRYLIRDT